MSGRFYSPVYQSTDEGLISLSSLLPWSKMMPSELQVPLYIAHQVVPIAPRSDSTQLESIGLSLQKATLIFLQPANT